MPDPTNLLDPSWAAILAALAAMFTAVGGLVMSLSVLLPTLRASRTAVEKVAQVHDLVNSGHVDAQRYQAALVGALREADVAVPPDQSLGQVDSPPPGRAAP